MRSLTSTALFFALAISLQATSAFAQCGVVFRCRITNVDAQTFLDYCESFDRAHILNLSGTHYTLPAGHQKFKKPLDGSIEAVNDHNLLQDSLTIDFREEAYPVIHSP